MNALIGYTGFVGSNLLEKINFEHLFNSKNIKSIVNQKYDLVICSGIPSAKWMANNNPVEDLENIKLLINCLYKIKCNKLILISSIDVFQKTFDNPTLIKCNETHHPYGYNRYYAEIEIKKYFRDKLIIVRLPAIFGKNLKKNVLYDLINNKFYKKLNLCDTYQWYDIKDLADDLEFIYMSNMSEINLFGEPISMEEIVKEFFAVDLNNMFYDSQNSIKYDLNVSTDYLIDYWITKNETMEKLKNFLI